ncbi:MAG: hydrogenase 3 maturation endopeptidase HyCI [Candidatus Omnitrophica bacterium]|nr:hydrogenase 3 maturation endopeptidase HyCI [Candidatus Omnitrophota bacterium]
MFDHLKERLRGKVVIMGMGNIMRSDDGAGSILAGRIKDKVRFIVWDVEVSPENYLGKVVKEAPDTVLLIDAADFGGKPGEFSLLEAGDIQSVNVFSTHNSSISLVINYLQSEIKADIIVLIIQPKLLAFGDELSQEVSQTLAKLESWFCGAGKK